MAVLMFKVRTDARNIYLYGTNRLVNCNAEYVEPIKKYAGETFSVAEIDKALEQGWITTEEHADTMNYTNPIV